MHSADSYENQTLSAVTRSEEQTNGQQPSAGKNAHERAFRQRLRSLLLAGTAGILVAIALVLDYILRDIGQMIQRSLTLPFWVYGMCFVIALLASIGAAILWKRAEQSIWEAKAEFAIGKVLYPLTAEGWQIRYGIPDPEVSYGKILAISPNWQTYLIDVKSQKGWLTWNGRHLLRWVGKSRYSFSASFLNQTKQTAIALQQTSGERFIIPIIAFANARVELPKNPIAGVYVVDRRSLPQCLRLLG
jgi:hypothetical protein